jgi:hypothetical protein
MARSKKFKAWHRIEAARRTGKLAQINQEVERLMKPRNLRVEGKSSEGKWEELVNG